MAGDTRPRHQAHDHIRAPKLAVQAGLPVLATLDTIHPVNINKHAVPGFNKPTMHQQRHIPIRAGMADEDPRHHDPTERSTSANQCGVTLSPRHHPLIGDPMPALLGKRSALLRGTGPTMPDDHPTWPQRGKQHILTRTTGYWSATDTVGPGTG
jgi:hypothetical protein